MVMFSSSDFDSNILAVWLKAAPTAPGTDILGQLRQDMEVKWKDRTDFAGWKVRPESVRTWVAAGQPALSAVADYTESGQSAEKMAEYMIWVRSLATHAFFFGRAKAADLAALQSGLDRLAATAVVP
jgi:hypothetical protein